MFAKRATTAKGNARRRAFPVGAALLTATLGFAAVSVGACAARRALHLVVVTPAYAPPEPSRAVLYTATRCVRALAVGADGTIWAATEGGVVRWANGATVTPPRVWTTANGLASNDIRAVTVGAKNAGVTVSSPMGVAEIAAQNGEVAPRPAPILPSKPVAAPVTSPVTATARGANGSLAATASGLVWTPKGAKGQAVALPVASRASHVSALAPVPDVANTFAAGLYGDGAYRLTLAPSRPPVWERLPLGDECRFVTALAFSKADELLIGTRRNGAFRVSLINGKTGERLPDAQALPSGDIYGLAAFRGPENGPDRLFATTFDQGVLEIGDRGLVRVHPKVAQGRALAAFGDRLYALRADHTVWAFDGEMWTPAWPAGALRRPAVYSLSVDRRRNRLLVGGWGGWAEWDGIDWRQHWNAPDLADQSVTAIIADADGAIWLGTQRKGLIRCAPGDSAAYTVFHEAHGLTDDWITALAVSPQGRLLVGTYTGGLLERTGDRFTPRFRADKWTVRAIAFRGETALAATPVGVWEEPAPPAATGDKTSGTNRQWQNIAPAVTGGTEAQTLLVTRGGTWVGTRSGLAFVPR